MTLNGAILALNSIRLRVLNVSRFFATPCFPAGAGPDYVNAAVLVETDLEPEEILSRLNEIEAQFERVRETRWAGRTLDIDLIGGEDIVMPDPETYEYWRDLPLGEQMVKAPDQLVLPHPRMHERAFVLVPLNDIAPDWVHPVSGFSVSEMLDALPKAEIEAVSPL